MLIVGLTGGVGSGKTTISGILKEEGAYLIDTDQIARELVLPCKPAWDELVKVFGKEILAADGSILRKKLAAIVFADPGKREVVNRTIHPRIREEVKRRTREIAQGDSKAIVLVDGALLVETGYYREMDKLIVVTSTEAQQIERVRMRDGASDEEARRILASQLPLQEKVRVADFLIRNEGSLEETRSRAKEVFQKLKRIVSREIEEDKSS